MNPLNKYEAIGVFVSVAIMALALGFLRFESDKQLVRVPTPDAASQSALVVVAEEEEEQRQERLADTLSAAATADGELTRLVIDDVHVGRGDMVTEGDTVTVHYIGTTRDGVQFDNSYERGEPFTFTVGEGKVIAGWEQGLLGMQTGGQRVLVIPPALAYGNRQIGPIPPNSPLVFAIELIEISE